MVKSCCVVGCTSRFVKGSGLRFFKFPKTEYEFLLWVRALKRENWMPSPFSVVCGKHFQTGKPNEDPTHPDFVPNVFLPSKRKVRSVKHDNPKEHYERLSPVKKIKKEQTGEREGFISFGSSTEPNACNFTDAVPSLHYLETDYKPSVTNRCLNPSSIPVFRREASTGWPLNRIALILPTQGTKAPKVLYSPPVETDVIVQNSCVSSSDGELASELKNDGASKGFATEEEFYRNVISSTKSNKQNNKNDDASKGSDAEDEVYRNMISNAKQNNKDEAGSSLATDDNSNADSIVNMDPSKKKRKLNNVLSPKKVANEPQTTAPEITYDREDIFGQYVAGEMRALRDNPLLYLQTKQSILEILTSANFELINPE